MSRQALTTTEEMQVRKVWFHRGQIAVALYLSILCIASVLFLGAMLARGQYVTLAIAALVATASCLSGVVAWAALSLAQTMLAQEEKLSAQRERIALLEAEMQFGDEPIFAVPQSMAREQANPNNVQPNDALPSDAPMKMGDPQSASGYPDPAQLDQPELAATLNKISHVLDSPIGDSGGQVPATIEGDTSESLAASNDVEALADRFEPVDGSPEIETDDRSIEERFLDAVDEDDLATAREALLELNGTVSPDRRTELESQYSELRARVASRLRAEFGDLLRAEDYQAAIHKGDEISQLLPDSRMRSDFEVIRPHLEARVTGL